MSDENVKKMNFFNRVIISIKDFEKYVILASERIRTAISYLAILIIIFSLVASGAFTYKFVTSLQKGIDYLKNNINQISYSNENLSINHGEEIKLINSEEVMQIIIINTNATKEQIDNYTDTISKYENGIIFINDRIIYKNQMLSQNIEYMYKDILSAYNIASFEKDDVLNFIFNVNNIRLYSGFFGVTSVYMFVLYFVSTLVDAIMLAVLGYILARIIGIKIKFKATFNMGIYALTLPIILNLIYMVVNTLTGFEVKYFQWMYTTISYIYMLVALLMIKTDLINRQIELMKIVEEQEKVKKEIEQREREKQEEEKKEPKEDNDKEEKKKDKKKKDNKDDGVGDSRACSTRIKI